MKWYGMVWECRYLNFNGAVRFDVASRVKLCPLLAVAFEDCQDQKALHEVGSVGVEEKCFKSKLYLTFNQITFNKYRPVGI